MIIIKITHGSIVQEYDTETNRCVAQSFITDDQVEYEDPISGASLDSFDENGPYLPFDMVQPNGDTVFYFGREDLMTD